MRRLILGLTLIIIGCATIAGIVYGSRKHYYSIKGGVHPKTVSDSVFQDYLVSYWKKMLPELQANSAQRMASDPKFQLFLKKQEDIASRAGSLPANTIDESFTGKEDIQMGEAINIVKDMIRIEAQSRDELEMTGSD